MKRLMKKKISGFLFKYVWGPLGCVLASSLVSRKLFNRFAQSARPGSYRPSDDRTNPNEQEKKQTNKQTQKQQNDSTTTQDKRRKKRTNKQRTNDPRIIEKWSPKQKIETRFGRKWWKNGPKTNPREQQITSERGRWPKTAGDDPRQREMTQNRAMA